MTNGARAMFTQQDRARVGAKILNKDIFAIGSMAARLRMMAVRYRRYEDLDTDVLLDLADQLDQIAMPIVVKHQS